MQNNIADALPVPLLHSRATTALEGGATATVRWLEPRKRLLEQIEIRRGCVAFYLGGKILLNPKK